MIQWLKLEDVQAWPYRSRSGGAIKLRFEGPAFVYIHNGSEEQFDYWKTQIGKSYFIRSWLQADYADPRVYWQRYDFADLSDLTGQPASFKITNPS